MTEYSRAYNDSFLIGLGAAVVDTLWILSTDSLLPLLLGAGIIISVLFLLPILLVFFHVDGPLSIRGPHQ
jgi:hypothetical protein